MNYEQVDEEHYKPENGIVLRVPYKSETIYGLYNAIELGRMLRQWYDLTHKVEGITDAIQSIYESGDVDFDDLNSLVKDYDLNVNYERSATVTVKFDMKIKCSPTTSADDAVSDIDFAFNNDLITYYEIERAEWQND